jgi:hypothetical protein
MMCRNKITMKTALINESCFHFFKALLKANVDFLQLLIGAEGLDSCGMKRSRETPQAPKAPRRLPELPAESEHPERKSTTKFKQLLKKSDF